MGRASCLSEGGGYPDGAQGPLGKEGMAQEPMQRQEQLGSWTSPCSCNSQTPLPTGPLGSPRPFGAEGSFLRTCSCAPSNARCCFVQRRTLLTSTQQDARGWSPDDARMLGIQHTAGQSLRSPDQWAPSMWHGRHQDRADPRLRELPGVSPTPHREVRSSSSL